MHADVSVTEGRELGFLKQKQQMKMFKQIKSCILCLHPDPRVLRRRYTFLPRNSESCHRVFERVSLFHGLDGFNTMNEGSGNTMATQVTLSQIGHLVLCTAWCTDRQGKALICININHLNDLFLLYVHWHFACMLVRVRASDPQGGGVTGS